MNIRLRLHRPFDRNPDDHLYGEPFDTEVNKLVGGESNWSSPRKDRSQQPRATVQGQGISIELHEDGPLIEFLLQNIDQIPNYISAISGAISAWAATRALRRRDLAKDDFHTESGTIVEIGDLRFQSKRDLKPEEVIEVTNSLAKLELTEGGLGLAMDRSSRDNRHYQATPLPTLRDGFDIVQNRDLLLKLYDQVCSVWKELVGVRFKLLGLVPTVSLALLVTILSAKGSPEGLSQLGKLLVGVFGFFATFGLFVYDRRNSVLHDDLISRGEKD
jgi:hypothetical protein